MIGDTSVSIKTKKGRVVYVTRLEWRVREDQWAATYGAFIGHGRTVEACLADFANRYDEYMDRLAAEEEKRMREDMREFIKSAAHANEQHDPDAGDKQERQPSLDDGANGEGVGIGHGEKGNRDTNRPHCFMCGCETYPVLHTQLGKPMCSFCHRYS